MEKDKRAEYNKKYYAENKDKILEYMKQYYKKQDKPFSKEEKELYIKQLLKDLIPKIQAEQIESIK